MSVPNIENIKCTSIFCVPQKQCEIIRLIISYFILTMFAAAVLISLISKKVIGNSFEKLGITIQHKFNENEKNSNLTLLSSSLYALGNFLIWWANEIIFASTFITSQWLEYWKQRNRKLPIFSNFYYMFSLDFNPKVD